MKDLWSEAKWAWGNIWAFYLVPFTSLRDGYKNKLSKMSVTQTIVYPFNAIANGYKAWNELDNAHRQSKSA